MKKILSGRYYHLGLMLSLSLAIALIYSNILSAPFCFDDIRVIVNNYTVRHIDNPSGIFSQSRFVAIYSFALNFFWGGLNVKGYHIVNICLHIINTLLVYLFLLNTFGLCKAEKAWSRKIAGFSAALFAVHPLQTGAVTYIVQRMEIMAGLFYLLALIFFINSLKTERLSLRIVWLSCVFFSFLLGFFSKEMAATMPVVILLYAKTINGKTWLTNGKSCVFFAVLFAGALFFCLQFLLSFYGGHSGWFNWRYLLTQFNVLPYYLVLLLFPGTQNLDYDFPVANGLFNTPQLHDGTILNSPMLPPVVPMAVMAGIIGYAVYNTLFTPIARDSRLRLISFFILWFFIILAPTSSIFPIADPIFEHRVYLASVGIFVITAIIIDWLLQIIIPRPVILRWAAMLIPCVIVGSLALTAHHRNEIWRDPLVLWRDCVKKSPAKARPHDNLGACLANRGDLKAAVREYKIAIDLKPDYPVPHKNMGLALMQQGRVNQAVEQFKEALRIYPNYAEAHNALGFALLKVNRVDEAIAHFNEVTRLDPTMGML